MTDLTKTQLVTVTYLMNYCQHLNNPVAKQIIMTLINKGEVKILKDVVLENADDLTHDGIIWSSDEIFSTGKINGEPWYNDVSIHDRQGNRSYDWQKLHTVYSKKNANKF